jgi:hypothetical protein
MALKLSYIKLGELQGRRGPYEQIAWRFVKPWTRLDGSYSPPRLNLVSFLL